MQHGYTEYNVFCENPNKKNVQFSENETVTIGESAFEDCGLVDIVLPGSVRSVGDNAFSGNYETDPRSLEHYATTYDKYKEYQAYMKEQTEAEAKNPSIKSVNIPHVEAEGELKNTKQYKKEGEFGHYGNLCVQDFEIEAVPDCSSGFMTSMSKVA